MSGWFKEDFLMPYKEFNHELYHDLLKEVGLGRVVMTDNGDDLVLFTYSRDCMFDRSWNVINRLARGIIFSRPTDTNPARIVAKPFPKFFNYGEETLVLPDLPFEVTTKMDGSLGIIYHHKGRWNVATKGSFKSEQAMKAEEILYRDVDLSVLSPDITYLVEIVYPENRIVIKYTEEKLVLLGAYDRITQQEVYPVPTIPGLPRVETHTFSSVDEIVSLCKKLPGTQEGFVVRFSNGYRVKIKGDEYVKLHKMMSDFTPIRIWEVMRDCINIPEYMKDLPEEFHEEFYFYANRFEDSFGSLHFDVVDMHEKTKHLSDKECGLWIKQEREAGRSVPAHDFLFLARKKNWIEDSLTNPKARKSAFDLFRPKGGLSTTRLNIKKEIDNES